MTDRGVDVYDGGGANAQIKAHFEEFRGKPCIKCQKPAYGPKEYKGVEYPACSIHMRGWNRGKRSCYWHGRRTLEEMIAISKAKV